MDNFEYRTEKVNDHLIRIIGVTDECAYLVIGGKRALLIDTCCGCQNMRKTVDSLTSLPYDVVLTHGHVDHVGGAGRFSDKVIYLNKLDWKSAKLQSKQWLIKWYAKQSLKMAHKDFNLSNYEWTKNTHLKYVDLPNGKTFDLGDIHLKVIVLPGHTKGMTTLLLIEDRLLLTGDSCNPATFLFLPGATSVKTYHENLVSYIPKVKGRYDAILLSHFPKYSQENLLGEMERLTSRLLSGQPNDDIIKMGLMRIKVAKKIDYEEMANNCHANVLYRKLK